jgi:NDP-sugar pyrophosphorylase family protein
MQLVLLAAGRGERLRPLTDTVPKALVEVQGKPIIDHVIAAIQPVWLIDEIVVCTGWLWQQVENYFCDRWDYDVKFSSGGPRGAAGDLLAARPLLRDRFFVLNADTVVDCDLEQMRNFHSGHDGLVTLGVKRTNNFRDANVGLDRDGRVRAFGPAVWVLDATDAGVSIWEKAALDFVDGGDAIRCSDLVERGLMWWREVDSFVDLGTLAALEAYSRVDL